ncbi:MAG TPA: EamA family transporter [Candidatus Polarisedimenticolaceae bacterium]|nr:EamA family transporter [Candidatus Polarisedimenticolaceae bacterium]
MLVGVFAGLCLIWGTTWAAVQIGLSGIPPFAGVSLRFGIAALILLVLALFRGVRLGARRHERWLWLANGLLSFCVSYGVVYWCEQWVPSGLAAILFATYPLFVAVLGHFVLPNEGLARRELSGILVGFAGVALIFSEDLTALGGPQVALASVVMLASPIASALSSVAIKRWGQGIHPLSISAMPMAIGAGVMAGISLALERGRPFVADATSIGALLYLAIFGSAVTFTGFYWLLERLPAKRLALIAYFTPVIAVLVGNLRGEPFTLRILSGAALVVGGVALAVQRPGR